MCGAGPMAALGGDPRGGDRRSGRIEGAAAFLLAKVEEIQRAITLAELQALLKERDRRSGPARCGGSSIAMGSALKKTAHAPSRSALTSPRAGWPGSKANPISIPADWCSSMRPAPRPRWPVRGGRSKRGQRCLCRGPTWTLEDNYLHRRSTPGWPDRADAPGRAVNGVAFLAYVEQVLVPTLVPGDQVTHGQLACSQGLRRQTGNRAAPTRLLLIIRPTSIPSNKPSPNSRPCSERPPLEPSMTYGDAIAENRTLHTNRIANFFANSGYEPE